MHGQVYGFFEQSFFQLFDENSFAADLRDGSVQHFITGGFDDNDLRLDAGRGKQTLADKFRLPLRQQAAARADAQSPQGFSRFERNRWRNASTL